MVERRLAAGRSGHRRPPAPMPPPPHDSVAGPDTTGFEQQRDVCGTSLDQQRGLHDQPRPEGEGDAWP